MLSPSQQVVIENTAEALKIQARMLESEPYVDKRAGEYIEMAVAALEEQLKTGSVPSLGRLSAGAK